jgi:hypothetical protein
MGVANTALLGFMLAMVAIFWVLRKQFYKLIKKS